MQRDTITLCTDSILQKYLKEEGIEAGLFDKVLSKDEKMDFLENLDNFACDWFLDRKGSDYTIYKDISIGAGIHDEIMIFFHLVTHFIFLLEKIKKEGKDVLFYDSLSCRLPKHVVELIKASGGKIITKDFKYPYFCYEKFFTLRINGYYSHISYFFRGENSFCKYQEIADLKIIVKELFSKFAALLSLKKKKKFIYVYVMRNLIPFFERYLKDGERSYGLMLSHNSVLAPKVDRTKGIVPNLRRIAKLAEKGALVDSLRPGFFYKFEGKYKKTPEYKRLREAFEKNIDENFNKHFTLENETLYKFFKKTFKDFYIDNIPRFMKLVEFNYKKFSNKKIEGALQEFVHPIQAQAMSKLKKYCYLYPPNTLLHNQYFAPTILKKTSPFFKVISASQYDRTRYERLGFEKKDVIILDTSLRNKLRTQIKPFKAVDSLSGKTVLVLPPFVPCIQTFKMLIESDYLYKYLPDLMDVLEEFGVSKVLIRTHPGDNTPYNKFGYLEKDFHKYVFNMQKKDWKMDIQFSDSLFANLRDDIEKCDLAVGSMTGTALDVLIAGKDFILFDDSYIPFAGVKDCSIFTEHKPLVKRLRTKDELREHLTNYIPVNREKFLEAYLDSLDENMYSKEKMEALFKNV